MDQQLPSVKAIFDQALEIASAIERNAYLDKACAGDADLRGQVDQLLEAYGEAGSFLEKPAAAPVVTGDFTPADSLQPAKSARATEGLSGRIGPYRLLQEIGEGGMGSVFMAEQSEPVKRMVAIKIIKDGMDSKRVVARFEAERQALALMDHPNIARVLDAGATDRGQPYFVMELVKGVPLTQFCDARQLSVGDRLQIFQHICHAVQHAHQKGIIHRDLKPSNILVESHDGRPVPKIIDFGLAKAMHALPLTERSLFTNFGAMLGTPLYMAPEQAEFSAIDVDTRADIYALGVILYELLTGTTPLEKGRLAKAAWEEIRRVIKEEEPQTPSARLSSSATRASIATQRQIEPHRLGRLVRGDLDWIVMKALAKERDRRYETANAFAADVERFRNHEPVTAGPPTVRYKLRKFVRRNRGPVVAASLVLLALVAGVVGTTWGLLRAREARQAEAERADGERQAKEAAGQRLDQVKKGITILGSVFHDLSPDSETKEDKSLRVILGERLDQATKQLDAEAVGDSLAVARLQRTLGQSQLSLGYPQKALTLFTKARDTNAKLLGPKHPDTILCMLGVASALDDSGRWDDALPLFEQVWKLSTETLGATHRDTVNAMASLAYAYQTHGRPNDALPLYKESLRLRKENLGPKSPDTLWSMNNLAYAYDQAGRLAEATALYEEALPLFKEVRGAAHRDTLITMNNLAMAYQGAGRVNDALPIHEECLRLRRQKLGAAHRETLVSLNNLALAYEHIGRSDRSLPMFEECLQLTKEKLGPLHPDTILGMYNLANAYDRANRHADALPLWEQTVQLARRIEGPTHPHTLASISGLAGAYQAAGRVAEALPLFEESLKGARSVLGLTNPHTLMSMNNLAGVYVASGRLPDAVRLLEEALQLARDNLGKTNPDTIEITGSLAGAYLAANQPDRAMPLFREFTDSTRKELGPDSPRFSAILAEVGASLIKYKQPAEAEVVLRESVAIRVKRNEPVFVLMTLSAKSLLGAALSAQQKFAEAEPLLLEGYNGLKQRADKLKPVQQAYLTDATERLVQHYQSCGKPDEATNLRKELETAKTAAKP